MSIKYCCHFIIILNPISHFIIMITQMSRCMSTVRKFNVDSRYQCLLASTRQLFGVKPVIDCVILLDTDWSPSGERAANYFISNLSHSRDVTTFRSVFALFICRAILPSFEGFSYCEWKI